MKRTLSMVAVFAALFCVIPLYGQITVHASDFPSDIGVHWTEVSNENTSLNPGSPGANQTWDLHGLIGEDLTNFEIIDRSSAPDPSWFPAANLIIEETGEGWPSYIYGELTDSYFKVIGFVEIDPDTIFLQDVINEPGHFVFPILYGNSWMALMYTEEDFQGGILANIDSIWIVVDGWGTVILDDMEPMESLRLKMRYHSVVTFNGILMEETWTWQYSWATLLFPEVCGMTSEPGAPEDFTEGDFWRMNSFSAADEPIRILPVAFQLNSAYPNPFNPETTIPYSINQPMNIELSVFNVLGQKVRTLVNGQVVPGLHSINWNGTDNAGHQVGAGIYYCRLLGSQGNNLSQKLILVR